MATLDLKEMRKFLWEGRGKVLPSWLSQFSFAFLSFAIFFWKMQRKTWYSILGVDAMPLSLKNLLLSCISNILFLLTSLLLPKIRVRIGEWDFSSTSEMDSHVERKVKEKIVHPKVIY